MGNGKIDEIKISPGTESLTRANLIKFLYYNEHKSFLNIVETLLPFDESGEHKNLFEDYKMKSSQRSHIITMINLSNKGEIYLTMRQKNDYLNDKLALEKDVENIKTKLVEFVVKTMESKQMMEAEFTPFVLKKLPLTLRGARPEMNLEEEFDEEEYDDYS